MKNLLALILVLTASPVLQAQSLPGLTIMGNTFTYDAPDGQVTGIIRMPSGSGPFPAVLISHGKGGAAGSFSIQHANVLVGWGFACIGPNYTHEGSNVNPSDNEGYCPENSRRARRCLDILASAASVDMTRLALFGHSMGSFLSGGLAGEIPAQIKAACISAGGTADQKTAKAALRARFLQLEINANFVTNLRHDRDALDQIDKHNTTEVQEGTEDTATITTQLTAISKEVDILDPILGNKYETNPDKLHAWERASRVERDPKRGKKPNSNGDTPAPPATPK